MTFGNNKNSSLGRRPWVRPELTGGLSLQGLGLTSQGFQEVPKNVRNPVWSCWVPAHPPPRLPLHPHHKRRGLWNRTFFSSKAQWGYFTFPHSFSCLGGVTRQNSLTDLCVSNKLLRFQPTSDSERWNPGWQNQKTSAVQQQVWVNKLLLFFTWFSLQSTKIATNILKRNMYF